LEFLCGLCGLGGEPVTVLPPESQPVRGELLQLGHHPPEIASALPPPVRLDLVETAAAHLHANA
jgi:hypothetical protein